MFIHRIPRKNKRSTHISYLLQESYRENKKVKNRTIANITNWPEKLRLDFEALLKGGQVIDLDDNKYFEHKQGKSYGAIKVIAEICKELGITKSLGRTKYSKLILMLIAGIILSAKKSKNYIANNWRKNQAVEEVFNLNKYFNEDDLEGRFAHYSYLNINMR